MSHGEEANKLAKKKKGEEANTLATERTRHGRASESRHGRARGGTEEQVTSAARASQ
jgi:hypothetical protein